LAPRNPDLHRNPPPQKKKNSPRANVRGLQLAIYDSFFFKPPLVCLALKVNTGGNQAGACAANCGQNAHFSLLFFAFFELLPFLP